MPQRLRIRLPGRLRLRHVAVALLALLGLVSLGVGIGLVTVWQPDDTLTSRAAVDEPGLVVTTAPGVLESLPGTVTVTARGSDGGPVLLALGLERDVEAYVEGLPAATVTGFTETDPTVLTTSAVAGEAPAEGETPLGDPAQSDLWVQQETGSGEATLTYDPAQHPGRWLLVAAGDGTTPAPDELTFTWPVELSNPWATPLIVLGVLLLLAAAGLAAWLFWWSAVRPAAVPGRPADDEPGAPSEAGGPGGPGGPGEPGGPGGPGEPGGTAGDDPAHRAVAADRTEEQR